MFLSPRLRPSSPAGKVRVRSSAVTAAGMGGHTLLTLGTLGLIERLPDDCCVMHMGVHTLDGWPDEQPQQLLMVLPFPLRHRAMLPDLALRTSEQLLGSSMDALLPLPAQAPRGMALFPGVAIAPPVLVALQVRGSECGAFGRPAVVLSQRDNASLAWLTSALPHARLVCCRCRACKRCCRGTSTRRRRRSGS